MENQNQTTNQSQQINQPQYQQPVQPPYPQAPTPAPKKPWYKKWWVWVIVGVLVIGVIGSQINKKNESKTISSTSSSVTKSDDSDKQNKTDEDTKAEVEKNIVVYDNNGIKLTYKGYKEEVLPELTFLLENDSDKTYSIRAEDVSINDYMISTTILESIAPGKKVNTSMAMFKSDLEKNGITKIEKVEFKLHGTNSDDYTDKFESDVITITDP